jgi:hypothetical protein
LVSVVAVCANDVPIKAKITHHLRTDFIFSPLLLKGDIKTAGNQICDSTNGPA